MACNGNCNACGISCNCNIVQATSIVLSGGVLIIVIPDENYVNHQMVNIRLISTDIVTQSPPVQVQIGLGSEDSVVNVITENGNYLYSDQVQRRGILRLMVATDSGLFVKRGCFLRTDSIFPEPLVVKTEEVTTDTEGS